MQWWKIITETGSERKRHYVEAQTFSEAIVLANRIKWTTGGVQTKILECSLMNMH